MITRVDELIAFCDQEITMREYCSQHKKIIRKGWESFSSWMEKNDLEEVNEEAADAYCGEIIGAASYADLPYKEKMCLRSVRMLVSYQKDGDFEFRIQTVKKSFVGSTGEAMQQYLLYLRDVVVLKENTISNKRHYLLLFNEFLESGSLALEKLTGKTISDFYHERDFTLPMLHNCNSTLKLFLRYAYDCGITLQDHSIHILPDSYKSNSKIPTTYTEDEIRSLLAAVSRSSSIGKRDYLVLLLAAEYGWRASDIVRFSFDQIDWDNNKISLQQYKTDVPNEYPLLSSVGNAIIDYLKNGRPLTDATTIIVSAESLKRGQPMHKGTMHSIVAKYMRAAKIKDWHRKKHGPHALRHSLASNMLRNNVSMPVIGTVLGHQSSESTRIYLSIDFDKLMECPLPMPTIKTSHYRGWQP
jgi:site-specific recombinase XerD